MWVLGGVLKKFGHKVFLLFLRSDGTSSVAVRAAAPPQQTDRQTDSLPASLLPAPLILSLFLSVFALVRAHVSARSLRGHPFICQRSAARVRQPHNEPVCPRARQCSGEARRGGRDRFSPRRRRICPVEERRQLKVCGTDRRRTAWIRRCGEGGWGRTLARVQPARARVARKKNPDDEMLRIGKRQRRV